MAKHTTEFRVFSLQVVLNWFYVVASNDYQDQLISSFCPHTAAANLHTLGDGGYHSFPGLSTTPPGTVQSLRFHMLYNRGRQLGLASGQIFQSQQVVGHNISKG